MRRSFVGAILVVAMIVIAGCSGAGPSPAPSEIPTAPAVTPAPDDLQSPAGSTGIATPEMTGPLPEMATAYPLNITAVNNNPMNRQQFLEANREYIAFLAKELGPVKAEEIVNEEFNRSMSLVLLDPVYGNDTLISITIDPVEEHAVGAIFNITGSTNLPAGTGLTIVVFRGNFERRISPGEDPWHDPILRTAVVQSGRSGTNSWSYIMDTTGMVPDDYLVYVRESRKENAFMASTQFLLLPR